MSREIKFRGIRKEYNKEYHESEFKYGNLLNECSIGEVGAGLDSYCYAEVLPDTIGQFTGLKDKHGKEIYEGDIVQLHEYGEVYKEVIFKYGSYCIHGFNFNPNNCEVIGNIHQDKHLLK